MVTSNVLAPLQIRFSSYEIVILILTVLGIIIGYFERNWLRSLLQFRLLGRDIHVVHLQTRDPHVDIGTAGWEDEFEKSRGIRFDYLESPPNRSPWIVDQLRYYLRVLVGGEETETAPEVTLERGEEELILLAIRYNRYSEFGGQKIPGIGDYTAILGNVEFDSFIWWVHLWPPEKYNIRLPESEGRDTQPPLPSETSLHTHDPLVIDGNEESDRREESLVSNLASCLNPFVTQQKVGESDQQVKIAYPPIVNKQFFKLRQGTMRGELPRYTAGHNIFIPLWIHTPDHPEKYPRWTLDDSSHPKASTDDYEHRLSVVIDPPRLPFRMYKELRIDFEDTVGYTFPIFEVNDNEPIVEVFPEDTSEECDIAVVCCQHGDEKCGKEAIEKLLSVGENLGFRKPVKFVLANPRAVKQDTRKIDANLNRIFSDDSDVDPDDYEVGLAEPLREELADCKVLDLHSTETTEEPFALVQSFEITDAGQTITPREDQSELIDLVEKTGLVSNAADISIVEGGLISEVTGVSIECGEKGTQEATENAYVALRNFLITNGVFEEGTASLADPDWHIICSSVEEPDYSFEGENFERVERGEVFARDAGDAVTADGAFTPVLMAGPDEGYDDKLGFKARKISDLDDVRTPEDIGFYEACGPIWCSEVLDGS
ncbi:succinylglutamate desuccinylase/aspartoacylase family protein [Halorussus sp. MSC15.2]|uniref:succinylglutamate desuccinylase/aspartoacylase domain-containing protein n=1 Tax=Halorussus sp. MSC15.2 TaxID=2283638 RepID=UPI0013D506D5|nr:succinylglutamate desuccinylase/aspartoacylase family protein [Halorussus sp. MSC15.2]NEU58631.1 hypothetical protein [Halorussus sp. MSC15.2]